MKTNPDSTFVAKALNLKTIAPTEPSSSHIFSAVTTDSRKIQPGCLFVALKGDHFDAHDFILDSVKQGARGVLCSELFARENVQKLRDVLVFSVPDTLTGFRQLAAAWRREFQIPVIGVAGSHGKTTTKEFLTALLQGKWPKVLKTEGSLNGFVGIPITLMGLRPEHGAAVIEIGIDEIGTMQGHMDLVAPDTAFLTAIGPEHLEKLKDVQTVAREEAIALQWVEKAGGTILINLDDPWIAPYAHSLGGKKIYYTMQDTPLSPALQREEEKIFRGHLNRDQTHLEVRGLGMGALSLELPLLGRHNAQNLLAAAAVARSLGLTSEEIYQGLKTFKGAYGRSEIRHLPAGTTALCDYYNANPASVEAGLDLLTQLSTRAGSSRKRWACLADMLELGPDELAFHRGLANKLGALKVENVLLYGPRMRSLAESLREQGFSGKVAHFETQPELAKALLSGVQPGDVVMIKGSRGMKMEEVWKLFEKWTPHT